MSAIAADIRRAGLVEAVRHLPELVGARWTGRASSGRPRPGLRPPTPRAGHRLHDARWLTRAGPQPQRHEGQDQERAQREHLVAPQARTAARRPPAGSSPAARRAGRSNPRSASVQAVAPGAHGRERLIRDGRRIRAVQHDRVRRRVHDAERRVAPQRRAELRSDAFEAHLEVQQRDRIARARRSASRSG